MYFFIIFEIAKTVFPTISLNHPHLKVIYDQLIIQVGQIPEMDVTSMTKKKNPAHFSVVKDNETEYKMFLHIFLFLAAELDQLKNYTVPSIPAYNTDEMTEV